MKHYPSCQTLPLALTRQNSKCLPLLRIFLERCKEDPNLHKRLRWTTRYECLFPFLVINLQVHYHNLDLESLLLLARYSTGTGERLVCRFRRGTPVDISVLLAWTPGSSRGHWLPLQWPQFQDICRQAEILCPDHHFFRRGSRLGRRSHQSFESAHAQIATCEESVATCVRGHLQLRTMLRQRGDLPTVCHKVLARI